ncbi:MAG: 2-oxoacid:acceptor oxidoreductase subunit alpha [Planctomycetota bacterium]
MTTSLAPEKPKIQAPVINDFSIEIATVNGSGSQTANNMIMRSIFQMGVPCSGKNLFPSNIAGLPTWYTIRANKDGYIARKAELDILICMNPDTVFEDIQGLRPGAVCLYNDELPVSEDLRADITWYRIPFAKIVKECCPDAKLRRLVTNIIYVGVLDFLLEVDIQETFKALRKNFARKPKAAEINIVAAQAGYDWAKANLTKRDPYRVQRMDKTQGKIIIEGNAAAALGAVFAGVTVLTWYPITPSSSLCESMIDYLEEYRVDKATGKPTFAHVQAEDELASIGMVLGAGWAGARACTATAGPGISLMNEFIGLSYYAEIPAVIFDVQRTGPSTGLPTRTMQGDIRLCAGASHGDTKHPMLFPCDPSEAFEMAGISFDLAERLQTTVFVMLDLDLGMNNWMSDPFAYPTKPLDRGKVLSVEDLKRLGKFERYRDVDGDGIPYRTLPGTDHALAPYFTRGSGHNEKAQYSEKPADYKNNMDRLARKFETARKHVPAPVVENEPGAEIGFIAFGTTHHAMKECRDQLRNEKGVKTSYLRLRAYPFSQDLKDFITKHKRIYVVEQNRDGQMRDLIALEVGPDVAKVRSIRNYNGIPIDARMITNTLLSQEGK